MRESSRRRGVRAATAGAAMVLVALAAGCSGGAETMSGSADSGGSVDLERTGDVPEAMPQRGTDGVTAQDGPGAPRTVVTTRAVIRRGEVDLVTGEMNRARTEIDDLLAKLGGYLASEDTTNDENGRPERSTLVLRVPEPSFDEAMNALGEIGRTKSADRSSEDVTTQVIDVDTRVATKEASIARLQRFLRRASNVDAMIRIESELSERQAELESLKAQQKYLGDQTSMSTITARLRAPAAPAPHEDSGSGFLAGLEGGWHALVTVLVGAATVAGAVLPFLVLLALLGVPVWLLLRAAARNRSTSGPAAPPAPPAA